MRALYTAATGMAAQELNVQVISNNIANLRTTGFKKQRAAFQDLIYDHVRRVGAQAPATWHSSRAVQVVDELPPQKPPVHASPLVQRSPSSHAWPSDAGARHGSVTVPSDAEAMRTGAAPGTARLWSQSCQSVSPQPTSAAKNGSLFIT